jgi:hypothetical protein
MKVATNYEQWASAASMLDNAGGYTFATFFKDEINRV